MNTTSPSRPILKFWSRESLPILLQTGQSECGLVCLAMIASYWGFEIDMPSMRKRFSVSLKGMTMTNLAHVAKALNLQARPIKADVKQLDKLKLPAVLHWDMNHFVVLKSLSATSAVIHDPANGMRKVSIEALSKSYTGVALEATPSEGFKKQDEKLQFTWLSLIGNVKGLGRGLSQVLLLGLALQVVALLGPFYMQWIVDDALVSADRGLIAVLGIGFILLVILQFAIGITRSWITTVLSTDMNFQWLSNVFSHLLRLPLSYFENRHLGDVVSRFGSVRTIQRTLTTQLVEGVIDGLLVVLTLTAMFLYDTKLAAVASAAVLLYAALRFASYRALRRATVESIFKAAKQETVFLESVRGIQTMRLFCRTPERKILWMNKLADQMNIETHVAKLSIVYRSANTLLFGVERVVVIWLGALAVLDSTLTVGMLFAFLSYQDQFSQRTASLLDKIFELRILRIQGERLADIVLTEPEESELESEVDTHDVSADIEVRNVSFRYADYEPYVLKNVSLKIPAGQCIAISGPSGCGKTTLIKLLLGLLTPSDGEILIGGVNIKSLGLSNFRQMTGSVMQEDLLFTGTIEDNISFFDPSPNHARVKECAQMAAIDQEISTMAMGYLTLIGDLGSGLSGGQKQRVILARALYRSPRVLVLDEATSHLDLVNELTINNAIAHLKMTRVIVAHRPDTIAMAERIVLLDSGEICLDRLNTSNLASKTANVEA